MRKFFAATIAFAIMLAASLSAEEQEAVRDADTGLPMSRPFAFPERGQIAPFWAKRLTGYFTTSDGARLHYSVLLPATKGRFPTVLSING